MSAAFNTPAVEPSLPAEKVEALLRRELLAHGYVLHRLSDDGYLVTKWNLARACADLREVKAFVEAACGKRGTA